MYYINQEEIDARLHFLPTAARALRELAELDAREAPLLAHLAQERALQLGIEAVTDVGSMLIDGFMMRDASSYEDIVDVLQTEGVLPDDTAGELRALVALRRPLMQQYADWPRDALRGDLSRIAAALERFPPLVEAFIASELQPFAQREATKEMDRK